MIHHEEYEDTKKDGSRVGGFSSVTFALFVPFVVSLVLCLSGCQEKSMSGFKEFQPVVLTDEQGNRYVAEYTGAPGNNYSLKPLLKSKPAQ